MYMHIVSDRPFASVGSNVSPPYLLLYSRGNLWATEAGKQEKSLRRGRGSRGSSAA